MRAPAISLIVLLLSLGVHSQPTDCELDIKVRRNTEYRGSLGYPLRINCTVEFCDSTPPVVQWYKQKPKTIIQESTHIHTKWDQGTNSTQLFYLYFDNISTSDAGLYSCEVGDSEYVSHLIHVSLVAKEPDRYEVNTVTLRNNTSSTSADIPDMWHYIYLSAGIGGFVIIVIILSVLTRRGCKGKRTKKEKIENQYISMSPRTPRHARQSLTPHESLPTSRDAARIHDDALLPRPSQQQTAVVTASVHAAPGRDREDHIYSNRRQVQRGERPARGDEDEEESSLLYVSVNHQVTGARVRPPRPSEQTSEYAAIRVA